MVKIMEEWKDVPEYIGLYQVSNYGRVRSLNYLGHGKTQIMKHNILKKGYHQVKFCKNNTSKCFLVHRLVAELFVDNPNPYEFNQVNHKDEDKDNNHSSNLEWCNNDYNCHYGTRSERSSKNNLNNPLRSKQVCCIETGIIYQSINEAQRQIGCRNISSVCCGIRSTAGGYHWKYV